MALDSLQSRLWSKVALSRRLREIRGLRGMTQADLAGASGLDVYRIRNYELANSLPRPDDMAALAAGLGVAEECLMVLDYDSQGMMHQNLAIRVLWQLADTYGLAPGACEGYVFVRPTSSFMGRAVRSWASAFDELATEGVDSPRYREYALWKYRFHDEFDCREFPSRFPGGDLGAFSSPQDWERAHLSDKLRRLRERAGMRQADLARESGVALFTIRSYEQGRRLPGRRHLVAIANAYGIEWESLAFVDFRTPNLAVHTLFDIGHAFGLRPDVIDGEPVVRSFAPGLERAIECWAAAESRLSGEELEDWRDHYRDDGQEACRLKSRYRHATRADIDGLVVLSAMESDYDPYPGYLVRS